jgi:hypothetical protein
VEVVVGRGADQGGMIDTATKKEENDGGGGVHMKATYAFIKPTYYCYGSTASFVLSSADQFLNSVVN